MVIPRFFLHRYTNSLVTGCFLSSLCVLVHMYYFLYGKVSTRGKLYISQGQSYLESPSDFQIRTILNKELQIGNNSSYGDTPWNYVTAEDTRPICPILNMTKECHVYIESNATTGPSHAGFIVVNNVEVLRWSSRPALTLVRLDSQCGVLQRVVYFNHTWTNYTSYYETLPHQAMLLGVVFGDPEHVSFFHRFGISHKRQSYLDPQYGALSFVGWKGYPGHTRSSMTPHGRVTNVLKSTFHFGVPFNYSLSPITYSDALGANPELKAGGHWAPSVCRAPWKVALIIPYRKREQHLYVFLENMVRFLRLQNLHYTVFVIEQREPELFNRAALMNVGFLEARKTDQFDCYVFQDVDLIPEDLANVYGCSDHPRHLVVTRSVTDYKLRNRHYFGGGILMSTATIERINGFANWMFGWGGEDDDIYARVSQAGYNILRYPLEIGRYVSLPHGSDKGNPHLNRKAKNIYQLAGVNQEKDGLNTTRYRVVATELRSLFTHIFVQIPGPVSRVEAISLSNQFQIPQISNNNTTPTPASKQPTQQATQQASQQPKRHRRARRERKRNTSNDHN